MDGSVLPRAGGARFGRAEPWREAYGGYGLGQRRQFAVAPGVEQVFDAGEELAQGEPEQDRFGHSSPGVPHTGDEGFEVARRGVGQRHYSHQCGSN